ncbi:MAG: 16S rRNA (cytosine(1402)-N(4))-methyltransferase RsmH [Clostridia bacterium]|nr:16S rRNA (cytosine(1402)-N(4))-methyltransferase RsmH [Clostridia bacterium]
MPDFQHLPVMKKECIDALKIKSGGVYFDGTLGGGGHSYEILRLSAPNGQVIATDLDDYAISRAKERLKEFGDRLTVVKDNFKNFPEIKRELGIDGFDGILLDLGVSSFQLDDKSRGFSYLSNDEKLDMRMDGTSSFSAETVVNEYSEQELKRVISEYGEERFAANIAKNIVSARKNNRIITVGQLNAIIDKSIPAKFKQDGHPSKRTFQAIRIEVNGELDNLYETVIGMTRGLKKGGRIAILTFHSLEDRIVKRAFRELETDCICDKSLPVCVCGKKREAIVVTKHPITATEEELEQNKRAKSAKLRVAERV